MLPRPKTRQAGMLLTEVLFFIVCIVGPVSYWLYEDYQGKKVSELVDRENGVQEAHWSRAHSLARLGRLAADANNTRAPGQYLRILETWVKASSPPEAVSYGKPKSGWVMALETDEQKQVLAMLEKLKIAPDALGPLFEKMGRISPQLSRDEEKMLEALSSPEALVGLAIAQDLTDAQLSDKLEALGASKAGLRKLRFVD